MARLLMIFVLLTALAVPAGAEVLDVAPGGFTVRTTHQVAAAPAAVWSALGQVNRWWSSDHTWGGEAANLYLDLVAGEEFGERLPGGGTVIHMDVISAKPERLLRLSGGLGPLQGMAVTGVLSVELVPSGEGTALTATYTVGGYVAGGLEGIAPAVDRVITEQFTALAVLAGQ